MWMKPFSGSMSLDSLTNDWQQKNATTSLSMPLPMKYGASVAFGPNLSQGNAQVGCAARQSGMEQLLVCRKI